MIKILKYNNNKAAFHECRASKKLLNDILPGIDSNSGETEGAGRSFLIKILKHVHFFVRF